MQAHLEQLMRDILKEARAQGASQAEAGVSVDSGLSLTVRLGEVETLEYQRDRGLGLTVYFGHRKGSASSSDLSPAALQDTVRAACSIARYTAEDDCAGLADAELMATDFPDLDLSYPWEPEPQAVIDIATRCEDAARGYGQAHRELGRRATVTSHQGMRVYANLVMASAVVTPAQATASLTAQYDRQSRREHAARLLVQLRARRARDLEPPESVGRKAAERTVARLGARRIGTRKAPVLFVPELARGIVGSFLGAMRGGA